MLIVTHTVTHSHTHKPPKKQAKKPNARPKAAICILQQKRQPDHFSHENKQTPEMFWYTNLTLFPQIDQHACNSYTPSQNAKGGLTAWQSTELSPHIEVAFFSGCIRAMHDQDVIGQSQFLDLPDRSTKSVLSYKSTLRTWGGGVGVVDVAAVAAAFPS